MGQGFGSAYGCATLRSGKSVVVGRGRRTGKGEEFAVARLKVNGGLDGTFGKQGKADADFFDGNDTARDVVDPVRTARSWSWATPPSDRTSIRMAHWPGSSTVDQQSGPSRSSEPFGRLTPRGSGVARSGHDV